MITKLSLTDRCYLSPGAMAAAKLESYLLLHRPTPWGMIALKAFAAIILLVVCVRVIVQ